MKKTILTLALLIVSLVSFSQIKFINTDSLRTVTSTTKKEMLKFSFYFSDKYIMYGGKGESTETYTTMSLTFYQVKELNGFEYLIYKTKSGDIIYISEKANNIMIVSDRGSFIFY